MHWTSLPSRSAVYAATIASRPHPPVLFGSTTALPENIVPSSVRGECNDEFGPVDKVRARGVTPVHVSPLSLEGIVLVEQVILSGVVDQAIRVVVPPAARREVELGAARLPVETVLSCEAGRLVDHVDTPRRRAEREGQHLSFPGGDVLEDPVVRPPVGDADIRVGERVLPRTEHHSLTLLLHLDGDIEVLLFDPERPFDRLPRRSGQTHHGQDGEGQMFHCSTLQRWCFYGFRKCSALPLVKIGDWFFRLLRVGKCCSKLQLKQARVKRELGVGRWNALIGYLNSNAGRRRASLRIELVRGVDGGPAEPC